ncbi:hypothetical protein [Spirosoma linguale]|uniref:Uncharacterized protein n=1 Tax=Spirosoma linguale (strain ATCC 33905 / DSM 74 / LMG 10896 / Claus 1) TaxID=504472 RepID=D2QTA4_SPILD|nr:hypothetical protein Slin_6074 [Spirosoma linguale DSM 74]
MAIDDFYNHFNDLPSATQRVDLLWEILVKKDQRLIRRLVYLIKNPLLVENHNRFAAVLRELNQERFIQPLFDLITETLPQEPEWIYEYLLILKGLVNGVGKGFQLNQQQTRVLVDWIVSPERGSTSGTASEIVLITARNDVSKQVFIDSIQDSTLPFYTRLYALEGLIRHYNLTYKPLFEQVLEQEKDSNFKRFLAERIDDLKNGYEANVNH